MSIEAAITKLAEAINKLAEAHEQQSQIATTNAETLASLIATRSGDPKAPLSDPRTGEATAEPETTPEPETKAKPKAKTKAKPKAEPKPEPEAEPEATETDLTIDDVREALTRVAEVNKALPPKLLKEFGFARLSDVTEDKFQDVIEAANAHAEG